MEAEQYLPSDLLTYFKIVPAALVAYPIGVEGNRIAAVLAEKIRPPDQKGLVITFDLDSTLATLEFADSRRVTVLDYTREDAIMKTVNQVVVFDNILQAINLFGYPKIQKLMFQNNLLLFLYTYGVDENVFTGIQAALSPIQTYMWKATFVDQGEKIGYHLHEVRMTERQNAWYLSQLATEEMEPLDFTLSTYTETEKCCNLVYSQSVTTLLRQEGGLSLAAIADQFGPQALLTDAPKIRELFMNISLHLDQRHVIYTRYDDDYGINLLECIGRSFGYNIFVVTNSMKNTEKERILELFNVDKVKPSILLTNTSFQGYCVPENITQLHFLDGNLAFVPTMIDTLYKYRHYTIPPILDVHYYVAACFDGSGTIEAANYTQIRELINYYTKLWERAKSLSGSIVNTRDGRLGITV